MKMHERERREKGRGGRMAKSDRQAKMRAEESRKA